MCKQWGHPCQRFFLECFVDYDQYCRNVCYDYFKAITILIEALCVFFVLILESSVQSYPRFFTCFTLTISGVCVLSFHKAYNEYLHSNSVPPLTFNTVFTAHRHLLYPQVQYEGYQVNHFTSVFFLYILYAICEKCAHVLLCLSFSRWICGLSFAIEAVLVQKISQALVSYLSIALSSCRDQPLTRGSALLTSPTGSPLRLQWDWQELNLCIKLFLEGA